MALPIFAPALDGAGVAGDAAFGVGAAEPSALGAWPAPCALGAAGGEGMRISSQFVSSPLPVIYRMKSRKIAQATKDQ